MGIGAKYRERWKVEGELPLARFYFFALIFTSHRFPLSERLEQATRSLPYKNATRLFQLLERRSHIREKFTRSYTVLRVQGSQIEQQKGERV